jgi:hypothetical protein
MRLTIGDILYNLFGGTPTTCTSLPCHPLPLFMAFYGKHALEGRIKGDSMQFE